MKKQLVLLILLCTALYGNAQLLSETFESYVSTPRLRTQWTTGGHITIDTSFYRSGKQALRIAKSSQLIYKIPNEEIGKVELSAMTPGSGVWNISISIGSGLNFGSEDNWTKIEEFTTAVGLTGFDAKVAYINKLEQCFVRFSFEAVGISSPLYVDDIYLYEISNDAKQIIKEEKREERLRIEREKDFERLIGNASFGEARSLVKTYERLYTKRIKTLGMLYDKSNMIKIVSGTASTLGDFNQLSNPIRYQKYEQLQNTLFPKLEAIDTLFYSDQIRGRLETFFKKIENPLNLAVGLGDMFTGGAVSKVVDSFKGLITKGFSTERLEVLGVKSRNLKSEKLKGVRLYMEAKEFFKDIEAQNERTLILNKKVFDVYKHSKTLNEDVQKLFIDYLAFSRVVADKNKVIEISKNQDYKMVSKDVSARFKQILGSERTYNKNQLSERLKEIDVFMQRIDIAISEYNELSNQLSSFYSDFKSEVERDCPFRNVTTADKAHWDRNVNRIKTTIGDVEKAYNESYISVNFKQ